MRGVSPFGGRTSPFSPASPRRAASPRSPRTRVRRCVEREIARSFRRHFRELYGAQPSGEPQEDLLHLIALAQQLLPPALEAQAAPAGAGPAASGLLEHFAAEAALAHEAKRAEEAALLATRANCVLAVSEARGQEAPPLCDLQQLDGTGACADLLLSVREAARNRAAAQFDEVDAQAKEAQELLLVERRRLQEQLKRLKADLGGRKYKRKRAPATATLPTTPEPLPPSQTWGRKFVQRLSQSDFPSRPQAYKRALKASHEWHVERSRSTVLGSFGVSAPVVEKDPTWADRVAGSRDLACVSWRPSQDSQPRSPRCSPRASRARRSTTAPQGSLEDSWQGFSIGLDGGNSWSKPGLDGGQSWSPAKPSVDGGWSKPGLDGGPSWKSGGFEGGQSWKSGGFEGGQSWKSDGFEGGLSSKELWNSEARGAYSCSADRTLIAASLYGQDLTAQARAATAARRSPRKPAKSPLEPRAATASAASATSGSRPSVASTWDEHEPVEHREPPAPCAPAAPPIVRRPYVEPGPTPAGEYYAKVQHAADRNFGLTRRFPDQQRRRVRDELLGQVPSSPRLADLCTEIVSPRQFLPGSVT